MARYTSLLGVLLTEKIVRAFRLLQNQRHVTEGPYQIEVVVSPYKAGLAVQTGFQILIDGGRGQVGKHKISPTDGGVVVAPAVDEVERVCVPGAIHDARVEVYVPVSEILGGTLKMKIPGMLAVGILNGRSVGRVDRADGVLVVVPERFLAQKSFRVFLQNVFAGERPQTKQQDKEQIKR